MRLDRVLTALFSLAGRKLAPLRSRAVQRQAELGVEQLEDRNLLSVGQIASFFRADEASSPIVDYVVPATRTLDVDRAYSALEELDGDTLAYGFWTQAERSTESWHDFRTVVARLQTDHPEMEVLAYIGSPLYAGDGSFCWEDHAAAEPCEDAGRYDDYERWAREAAFTSLEFPIVKGILLD